MSRPSQRAAYEEGEVVVVAEPEERRRVGVTVEVVTRAVGRRSPGGTRRATATTTTTITVQGYGEEQQGQQEEAGAASGPAEEAKEVAVEEEEEEEAAAAVAQLRPVTWRIADGRRGALEVEPAKSNLARTHTLQGVAERLRERVATEAHQLLRLQEEVASATGARALDAVRLWYLEHVFHRRLRHHMQLVFREMHLLREVQDHFDPGAVAHGAGGPALRLLDDLSASASSASSASGFGSAPAALPAAPAALPAAPTSSQTPATRQRGESPGPSQAAASSAADEDNVDNDDDDDDHVSDAEDACALDSSGDSAKAAAEEVAAAMAAATVGGATVAEGDEDAQRFSPVQWSRDQFETTRTKGCSGSRNSSESLAGPARVLQASTGSSEGAAAAAVDIAADAVVEEPEASTATGVFSELQRQFHHLADTLRQHALVADGVLRQAGLRRQSGGGEAAEAAGAEQQRQPPPTRQLLLHEMALMHSEMQRTQASVLRSEAALQRIVDALPPAPTMVRLPPTPPLRPPRHGRLAWFSTILKRRLSRRKQ